MTAAERDEVIRALWLTTPAGEIARRINRERSTVSMRAKRLGLPPRPNGRPPLAECGTDAEYQRGCRCGHCCTAHREYHRRYRRGEIPPRETGRAAPCS